MKNIDVVRAWSRGRVASTKNLTSDGKNLYSYQLRIGYTRVGTEIRVVLDYTAPAGHFRSQTTSQHVNLAKRYGQTYKGLEMNPRLIPMAIEEGVMV
tara:strand:- start:463 stop:753 length:291 start_codon:yes stop_codon:yes gene_type:complete